MQGNFVESFNDSILKGTGTDRQQGKHTRRRTGVAQVYETVGTPMFSDDIIMDLYYMVEELEYKDKPGS